jgi:hypothetical protein
MNQYVIQFESRGQLGQDEEYNRWYDAVHLPDVLNVPGFKSAKRYAIVDPARDRPHYMAAYTVECDDPHALLGRLFEASKTMELSPALDPEYVVVTVYQPR